MNEKRIRLFDVVKSLLLQEPEFDGFVYRRKDNRFVLKFNGGIFFIELAHYEEMYAPLDIWGAIYVNYNICSEWFEKFRIETLPVHCDRLLEESFFIASLDRRHSLRKKKELFDSDYLQLRSSLIYIMREYIPKYSSLKKLYEARVLPIITGEKYLPEYWTGIETEFEYLTICRIVAPENYEKLKELVIMNFRLKYLEKEDNYMLYHQEIEEIFTYFESLDFNAMMNKKGWTKGDVISLVQFESSFL